MSYHDLVQMYFDRSNALQWYWTLYVVIIGGLLAFSSMRKERDLLTTALVTILFVFFAYKNLGAIRDVSMQRFAILASIRDSTPPVGDTNAKLRQSLEPTLVAPEYEGVRNFHALSDVLTVAAVWAMELRRRRSAAVKVPG